MPRRMNHFPAPGGDRKSGWLPRLLRSVLPPAVLLTGVLLCRTRPAWADAYALHFYPVWSGIASRVSSWIPISLEEIIVLAAIAGAVFCLFRLRRRWTALVSLLLWIVVWFYAGWGLNYFRSNIYQRAGRQPEVFEPQRFRLFLDQYAQALNEGYVPVDELDREQVEQEIKQFYASLPARWGLAQPKAWQRPKRLLLNFIYNAVGVSGYVGPFLAEIQINEDATLRQYPYLFAHELSHLLGVSNEAEANYWAWQACSASADPKIRYAAHQSLLPYVLGNARSALPEEEYKQWVSTLRPEVKEVYEAERAHWAERYSPLVGRIHGWFYDLFLKSNSIRSGTANYYEVIQILLTLEDA
ncbi:MAG: DUF3810 domain-containing protein [Bacteroidales bacterium]|nr:DUF3810 domain-containing protein [Bacteroidales bacterium]